jgi:hypothetical protein
MRAWPRPFDRVIAAMYPPVVAPQAEFRRIDRLVAIACYHNVHGYRRPSENYARFRRGLDGSGVELWLAELAFDDAPFEIEDARLHVRGSDRHVLWQRDRLANLLIQQLPSDVDAVAWIDADILFDNSQWPDDARAALERFNVVQLFEWARDVQADGAPGRRRPSFGYAYAIGHPQFCNLNFTRPGLAWAARADWLRRFGLLDTSIVGGNDTLMLPAFTTPPVPLMRKHVNHEWLETYGTWSVPVSRAVGGALGYVPGGILHLYHGKRENRFYSERSKWIADSHFDPRTDLELDPQGLWQWTEHALEHKKEMVRLVRDYFHKRRDDD